MRSSFHLKDRTLLGKGITSNMLPTQTPAFLSNKKFYTEYSADIIDCLFEVERNNIKIRNRSDQLAIRPDLIQLLKAYAKHQDYSRSTLHLAVYILDVYMDAYIISEFAEHQKLIGLVCLLLAAKSEDLDEAIPSIKNLLKIVDMTSDLGVDLRFKEELTEKDIRNAYGGFAAMYCKLEFLVFESLQFNAIRPTAISFLNIFQGILITEDDVNDMEATNDEKRNLLGDLRVSANGYLARLTSVILDVEFFNEVPSQLAAAIVCLTRKLLKIADFWNKELVSLTRWKIDDIRPLMILLLEKHMAIHVSDETVAALRDSGYLSPNSNSETEAEGDVVMELKHKKRKMLKREPIIFKAV